MPSNQKFPPSVEIKRVIAAAIRAGIEIGSIEIHSNKITIHPKDRADDPSLSEYDVWKLSQRRETDRVKHVGQETDAIHGKPRK